MKAMVERELRPSAQQRGLWFIQTSTPETCSYNLVFSARVLPAGRGLDVAALRRTFRRLTQRHEALRSNFTTRDGEPVLTVWKAETIAEKSEAANASEYAAVENAAESHPGC
jgi:hypothetical protein